jgi:hypothetical protein
MSVAVGFIAFDCKRYLNGNGLEIMPAVVGPRRIIDDVTTGGDQMQVILNACSNFQSCTNPVCGYSSYFRKVANDALIAIRLDCGGGKPSAIIVYRANP